MSIATTLYTRIKKIDKNVTTSRKGKETSGNLLFHKFIFSAEKTKRECQTIEEPNNEREKPIFKRYSIIIRNSCCFSKITQVNNAILYGTHLIVSTIMY